MNSQHPALKIPSPLIGGFRSPGRGQANICASDRNIFELLKRKDAKMCNCRGCEKELLGESHVGDVHKAIVRGYDCSALPEVVAVRDNGIPYCLKCSRFIAKDNKDK